MIKALAGCILTVATTLTALASPGFMNGQFVVPNEIDFQAYSDLSKPQGGALVSVGTFRGLIAMGQIDFSLLVQMDLDPGVVAFNQFNRQLLKDPAVTDRFVYLTKLFDREKNEVLLQEARTQQISDAVFLERLWQQPETSSANESAISQQVRLMMRTERKHEIGVTSSKNSELYADFQRIIKTIPGSWALGYLGSDVTFQKIKQLAIDNRIVIFQGSLTESSSLQEIETILKERKTKLAMLDVSNVFDYVQDPAPLRLFTEGLRRLPFSKTGSVVLTRSGAGFRSTLVNKKVSPLWTYYQISPGDFTTLLKKENGLQGLTTQTRLKGEITPLVVNLLENKTLYRRYEVLSCSGVHLRY
jgi:hypothetical protein